MLKVTDQGGRSEAHSPHMSSAAHLPRCHGSGLCSDAASLQGVLVSFIEDIVKGRDLHISTLSLSLQIRPSFLSSSPSQSR
jgi:hypothetical protein